MGKNILPLVELPSHTAKGVDAGKAKNLKQSTTEIPDREFKQTIKGIIRGMIFFIGR
jgi:hypothetical protein